MSTKFKPLLASPLDLDLIEFPLLVSPKLDGIRAIVKDGQLVSRKLLPIPNRHIQEIARSFPDGLDGEIMTYNNKGLPNDFNTIQGDVMRREGAPDFNLVVFDDCSNPEAPFTERLFQARTKAEGQLNLHFLQHKLVRSVDELMAAEEKAVAFGHEGLMVRKPEGRYKFGRSTAREQILLKMKRFHDDEALVIGMTQLMHNANEMQRDELGNTKRSSAKAGKVPAGVMGTLICSYKGVEFEIGTGFDAAQRKAFWEDPDILGQWVTFKYQELTPAGVPRFPVFIGIRRDL